MPGSAEPAGTDCADDGTVPACEAFHYGPDGACYLRRSTWTEEETADDGTPTTVTKVSPTYYAGAYEKSTLADGSTVERTRIGDGAIHVATTPAATDPRGTATAVFEYLHRDHLGSVEAVTDASGSELVVLGHDPYGGRRGADWEAQLTASETDTLLADHGRRVSRGFTGHEHLDRTGLVVVEQQRLEPMATPTSSFRT